MVLAGMAAGCGVDSATPPRWWIEVPTIPAPLDGDMFIADPCTALTVNQLASIGFLDGRVEYRRAGCLIVVGAKVEVLASWLSPLRENIHTLYRNHAHGHTGGGNRWDERTIQGYPAVIVWSEPNLPTRQHEGPLACRLALGVDDNTLVYLTVHTRGSPDAGPWKHDPCGAAEKIADFVVTNLRK